MFRCLELIALGVDLSAAFASTSLSASLGVSIQWGEGRFFQQVAGSISSELAEKVAGIGSVTSASVIGIAHDALHADLIGGFVGINVSLHDCDSSNSSIREWVLASEGSGSGAALREANFKGIHQAGNELDQLRERSRSRTGLGIGFVESPCNSRAAVIQSGEHQTKAQVHQAHPVEATLSCVDSRVCLVNSAGRATQKHLDEHAQNVAPLESAIALLFGRRNFVGFGNHFFVRVGFNGEFPALFSEFVEHLRKSQSRKCQLEDN